MAIEYVIGMTVTVRKTGSSTRKSPRSMFLICESIIAPTSTSAAAATALGTRAVSGVKNIASRKSTPVIVVARPVRAPSPMPAPDSTKTVAEEEDVPPPTIAPTPSTTSADLMRGKSPFSSARSASFARPVIVPIASKKFENSSVKMNITRVTPPTFARSKPKSTRPIRLRSGRPTMLPVKPKSCPNGQMRFRIAASTEPPTSAMRIAPLTRSAMSTPPISRVSTKSRVGREATDPPTPRSTGGEACFVEVTKPAFTNPMKAMNRPMPTVMASLSCTGTASKMSLRRPVAASRTMMTPLIMTSAIASAQVTEPTTVKARNALMPRPAANANGSRVISPNRIVMTPAVSAVAAATAPPGSVCPATSGVDRMIGLRITM